MKTKGIRVNLRLTEIDLTSMREICEREEISLSELVRRRTLPKASQRDIRMDQLESRMLRIEGDLSKEAYKWRTKYERMVASEKLRSEQLQSIDHVDGQSVKKHIVG